jgi:hypothetical protein
VAMIVRSRYGEWTWQAWLLLRKFTSRSYSLSSEGIHL